MKTTNNHIQYLGSSPLDEKWGLTVTTVGYQRIPAHSTYPSVTQHPQGYVFNPQKGRTLSEYQLIYIYQKVPDILNLLPASDKRSKPEPCY